MKLELIRENAFIVISKKLKMNGTFLINAHIFKISITITKNMFRIYT